MPWPRIVLARDVSEYRRVVPLLVSRRDRVLEIGCGAGGTTRVIAKYAGKVLAIDKSEKELEKAKKLMEEFPNLRVELADAWDLRRVLELVARYLGDKVDAVFIDIGGSERPHRVLDLARRYSSALRPPVMVIKNYKLVGFVESVVLATELVAWRAGSLSLRGKGRALGTLAGTGYCP